jgi:hypothetical protein
MSGKKEGKRRYVGFDFGKRTYTLAVIGKSGKVTPSNGGTSIEGRQALYKEVEKTDQVAHEAWKGVFVKAKEMPVLVG